MSPNRLQRLQEIAASKGKQLLIENFSISKEEVQVEVFDKPRLIEGYDPTQYTARGIIRNVRVGHFDTNRNGRKYIKPVFEKLEQNGSFNRGGCLVGHTRDGEDSVPDRLCGVWHNYKVTDFPRADLFCIGEKGSLLLEAVMAGYVCGFSLNGYGTMEEGNVVSPET